MRWLMWVAFKCDFAAYQKTRQSISGAQWIKGPRCPIPAWPEKEGL